MTAEEKLKEARRRAAAAMVRPGMKEKVLRGRMDGAGSVIRAMRAVEREEILRELS